MVLGSAFGRTCDTDTNTNTHSTRRRKRLSCIHLPLTHPKVRTPAPSLSESSTPQYPKCLLDLPHSSSFSSSPPRSSQHTDPTCTLHIFFPPLISNHSPPIHKQTPIFTNSSHSTSTADITTFNMFLKTSVASAILSAVCVDAFWRMECPHRLGLARVDPLMSPGVPAQHAHAIYGSNGMSSSPSSSVVVMTLAFLSLHIPTPTPGLYSASNIFWCVGFGVSSGFEQLAAGDCTSCRVTQDKSAYWHPQLYFQDEATEKYEEVDPRGGMLA